MFGAAYALGAEPHKLRKVASVVAELRLLEIVIFYFVIPHFDQIRTRGCCSRVPSQVFAVNQVGRMLKFTAIRFGYVIGAFLGKFGNL